MKDEGVASVPASRCPSCGVISPEGAHAQSAACIRALEAEVRHLREELKRLQDDSRQDESSEPVPQRAVGGRCELPVPLEIR